MSIALNYQLSIFGEYDISPTPELFSTLMKETNQKTGKIFLPNLIRSYQMQNTVQKPIGFITEDEEYSIIIFNNRIDVNYNRMHDNELNTDIFYDFALKAISGVMDYLNISANRLAINIQQLCSARDFTEVKAIGKKLINNIAYYKNRDLEEWSIRTNAQKDVNIEKLQEKLNVITVISSGYNILTKESAILFHIDINTAPQNQTMRFDAAKLRLFVDEAQEIALGLTKDIELTLNGICHA